MSDINSTIFISIPKDRYTELVGIDSSNANYWKVAFIDDGSGIITQGKLYVNSPYFITMVDSIDKVPEVSDQEANTIYMVTEE